ncbi:hypothetical protein PCYB_006630 [Plasmodium cynomolgi strain B]|uniref:CYIR protein n=1 Tax=Plasmodium cynomolgi (strain B) TaxID=1120755 RepID=K6V0Q2_PLACD|nr:hypothetical protein PCYB_006630 [Plasmodium cynomolgi strain B]GAB69914.1 hypothetical protein PCYB_006630 [Plasmodium cynomolgi strain B]
MTGQKPPEPKLEDESKKVGLDVMYKEFFSNETKPQNKNYCDVQDSKSEINSQAKELCSKLAWSKLNEKLGKFCVSPVVEDVTLNELKNRKYSYIYFKELGKIHSVSTSKNKDACSKYLKYLQSLSTLYQKYWKKQCDYFFLGPAAVDYFPCYYKYELSYLMSGLQNCKDGKEPYRAGQEFQQFYQQKQERQLHRFKQNQQIQQEKTKKILHIYLQYNNKL